MRIPIILLALLLIPTAMPAQASAGSQSRITGPQPSILWSVETPAAVDTIRVRRGSHWQTGAIVGGIAGALFGVGVMQAVCGLSESTTDCTGNTILGSLMFGGAGAGVGALIGGLFPRH